MFITQGQDEVLVLEEKLVVRKGIDQRLPPCEAVAMVEALTSDDVLELAPVRPKQEDLRNGPLEDVVHAKGVLVLDRESWGYVLYSREPRC